MKRVLIVCVVFITTAAFAAEPKGFVWGNQPAAASYAPDPAFAYNSAGGGINITRLGTGSYRIRFAGLSPATSPTCRSPPTKRGRPATSRGGRWPVRT